MKEIDIFSGEEPISIETKTGSYTQMKISCVESDKKLTVSGDYINKQYSFKENYIIFITDGTSISEILTIYYFDKNCNMLDSVELASLSDVACFPDKYRIAQENKIEFAFFGGNDKWRLTVLDKPSYLALLRTNCPFFTRPLRCWIHPAYLILNRIPRS